MDVSPRQMVSVATAMIPFLGARRCVRALMGSNMQRQAVPLIQPEAPFVGTGMEYRGAVDAGDVTVATAAGVVTAVSADLIDVAQDDGTYKTYRLSKFRRSNQGTCINQRSARDGRAADREGYAGWLMGPAPIMPRWRWAVTCWSRSCRGRATTTRTRSS